MNKLNGGYIMIDGTSTTLQADLKTAYETGRPVLYYDATGKAEYATITKKDNIYYVYKITDIAKTYTIDVVLGDGGDLPENSKIRIILTTTDDLLYMNTDDPDTAQSNMETLGGYMEMAKIEPQIVSTYTILGGYMDDERQFNLLYNDNGTVKFTQLVWDYINSMEVHIQ